MEKAALFCDETAEYRCPEEPDPGDLVTLRFRTAKNNADHVSMIICGSGQRIELYKAESRGRFDFYETVISVGKTVLRFYFEIKKGRETCLYNRAGSNEGYTETAMFAITPGFHVPGLGQGRSHVPDLH